jgi:hypothetical protein
MTDALNNPAANFTGFPAGYSPFAAIQQAMAPMQPGTPVSLPQMTPQSMSYGPMHSALAQQLAAALQSQMGGGLLGSPTASQMGLLSTAMTPATAVNMPHGVAPALGPDQYYRLNSAFWNAATPNTITSNRHNTGNSTADTRGRNDMYRSSGDNRSDNQSPYGNAGGGLSDYGQRSLADYGGIF